MKPSYLVNLTLVQDDWCTLDVKVLNRVSPEFATYLQPDLSDDPLSMKITDIQPHLLKAKASKSHPNNPTWSQAMNSADADKWWNAMLADIETIEVDLKAWKLIKHEPWIKVLPCTWAFCIMHFLDGLIKKFKA